MTEVAYAVIIQHPNLLPVLGIVRALAPRATRAFGVRARRVADGATGPPRGPRAGG